MAVFTAISMVMNMKAAKQHKKARKEQQKQQQVAARRSRTQALRQAQIAQSQARASGAGVGVAETSGLRGGLRANQSRRDEGIGFSTEMSGLSRNISMFQQKAANAMGLAGIGQAVSGLAMQGASLGMQMGGTTGATPARLPSVGFTTGGQTGYPVGL